MMLLNVNFHFNFPLHLDGEPPKPVTVAGPSGVGKGPLIKPGPSGKKRGRD
jgi:hypothetical protein